MKRCYFHFVLLSLVTLFFVACNKPTETARKVKMYQSPMHPWITSDQPGNCTICGMALVPVYEGDAAMEVDDGLITLARGGVEVLGVTTVPARKLELTRTLRFSGVLEDDENIHQVIAAFYDGRIEQVNVQHVGQYVEKGQPLASIYSPELLYVVKEFQNAMRGNNNSVARNSAQRLVQYGLTVDQVTSLAKQPDNVYTVDLLAPISGTILSKKAYKGQYIKTGEPLFEMGDLARLWFHAEVYERDLAAIQLGQKAILRSPTVPGGEFEGVVTFIDPNFDPRTRSTKVRIEVDNPAVDGDARGLRRVLPHLAYAEAEILADLGEALVVPRSALLRDGRRSVVYVEDSNGRYEQRSVQSGRVGDEGIEIVAGLKDGEKVVTEGNLMIDAEAQLRYGLRPAPIPSETAVSSATTTFLGQLAVTSEALAADDLVAAVQAGKKLPALAADLPDGLDPGVDALRVLPAPSGSDLKAVRQSFLPWSQAGAVLALATAGSGVKVFECPMTGDSFPGAPSRARWIQSGETVRNPYLGGIMLDCGAEVKP